MTPVPTLNVAAILTLYCYLVDTGQANYQLEVKTHSFSNLSLLNNTGGCCDCCGRNCCAHCNITLVYCPFYSESYPAGAPSCPLGCQSLALNDSSTRRSLVFNGISWPGYLNLSIQVYQCSFWYNVNRFFLQTIPLMVASNFTGVASHLGVYRNGNISLSFRVTCKQNFSGPSCFANSTSLNSNMSTMNPYLNGGTCMQARQQTYSCVCPTDYNVSTTIISIVTSSTSFITSKNVITTAVASQTVTTSKNASVAFTSAAMPIYTDSISKISCTGAAACLGTSMSAGVTSTATPGGVMETAGHAVTNGQVAIAPVMAGVVTVIVVVALVVFGAVTVAVFIVHKRNWLGTCDDNTKSNPTYDQNAVGVVTLPLAALSLERDFHNPIYSSIGIADAKERNVLVSDYEFIEYEVVKEREQSSIYGTLDPETM